MVKAVLLSLMEWECIGQKQLQKNLISKLKSLICEHYIHLDEELIFERVKLHGKCLVLTEEQQNNSFAEALAGRISKNCFQFLDAPVEVLGALNVPAVPMNIGLEKAVLPDAE